MFLVACKTAIVESLQAVWFSGHAEDQNFSTNLTANDIPYPRRITIEYPEAEQDWPFVLVQVRPTLIEWTGIMPDEAVTAGSDDVPVHLLIRQGRFEASCMLQVIGLTSEERDRIWDNIVKLLLMGRKRTGTNNFFNTLETHDLVGITIQEGSIRPVGDTISMGTPWNPELLSYEAAVEFDMTGVFFADEYNEELVALAAARVYEYIDLVETPYGENDGLGTWKDPWE